MSRPSSKSHGRPEVKKRPSPAGRPAAAPTASLKPAGQTITPDWFEAKDKLIREHLGGLEESVKSAKSIVDSNGLIGRSNVHGVYIGLKKRGDRALGELAIIVQVLKKVTAHNQIQPDALLPSFVTLGDKKYLVDVEQAPMAIGQQVSGAFPGSEKPARPGSSIGTDSKLIGTLGCLVMARRGDLGHLKLCILSNVHVLAMDQGAHLQPRPKDDDDADYSVFQPFVGSGGERNIGTLIDYIPPTLGGGSDTPTWSADAAIAWTDFDETAPERGTFRVAAEPDLHPTINQGVVKVGRTTGVTTGTIKGIGMDKQVAYGHGGSGPFAHFTDAILISGSSGAFSQPGDSGSIIVDSTTHKPVALLCAGDGTVTIANPIKHVVDGLRIETFLNDDNWDDFAK